MTPVDPEHGPLFLYEGAGDTFGEMLVDLLNNASNSTGQSIPGEALAELIDTALEAWQEYEGSMTPEGWGYRRVLGDWSNDFDIMITTAKEVAS